MRQLAPYLFGIAFAAVFAGFVASAVHDAFALSAQAIQLATAP